MISNLNKIIKKICVSFMAICLSVITFVSYINFNQNNVLFASIANGITAFPIEYQQSLKALQANHPNWTFTALNTGLNWSDVINAETAINKSLVPLGYDSWWKLNDVQVETGWVNASRAAVEQVMNPLNYISSEQQIFQFETLTYNPNIQNIDGIENILYGTNMSGLYKDRIEYFDKDLNKLTINKKYSDVIMQAGITYKVSPYHLASRIKQETACNTIGNLSINGKYNETVNGEYLGDYRGLYNFYNIGANGAHPVRQALIYAKTPGKYGEPWDNPEKSISGGANFIGNEYISRGQNTLYLQKFNVSGNNNFSHQYMTNILSPSSEVKSVYRTYAESKNGAALNYAHNFTIPVYYEMPGSTNLPEFRADNTRVYLSATTLKDDGIDYDYFSLRGEPNSNSTILKVVNVYYGDKNFKDSKVLVTRIGIGNGDYDKIRVQNLRENYTLEGYMSKLYIKELVYPKVLGISLNNTNLSLPLNSSSKLNVSFNPTDAWCTDVEFSSSNPNVATVDANGNVKSVGGGTAKIIVTSKDQGKQATCDVLVDIKVESIALPKDTYTMLNGKIHEIIPIINPTNACNKDYTITSDNVEVIAVEGKKIKSVGIGCANILFTTNDSAKTVVAKINVIDANESNKIEIKDLILDVTTNFVSNVDFDATVKSIKDKITTKLKIEIRNDKNEILADDKPVGTGSTINFILTDTNDVIETYTILIFGDIDGNGKLDSMDMYKVVQHLLGNKILQAPYLNVANTSRDDKNLIDSMDMYYIIQQLLGNSKIKQ